MNTSSGTRPSSEQAADTRVLAVVSPAAPRTLTSSATRRAAARDRWLWALTFSTWVHMLGGLVLVVAHGLAPGELKPAPAPKPTEFVRIERQAAPIPPPAPVGIAEGGIGVVPIASRDGSATQTSPSPLANPIGMGDASPAVPGSRSREQAVVGAHARAPVSAESLAEATPVVPPPPVEASPAPPLAPARSAPPPPAPPAPALAPPTPPSTVATSSQQAAPPASQGGAPEPPPHPQRDPARDAVATARDVAMNAPKPVASEQDETSGAGAREAQSGATNEPWVSSPPIASGPRSPAAANSELPGAAASERTVDAPAPNARASQSWDRALSAAAAPTRASRQAPAVVAFTPFVRSQATQGTPASDFLRVSAFDRAADAEVRTLNGAVLVGPSDSAAMSGRPSEPVAALRARRAPASNVLVQHREVATGVRAEPLAGLANPGEPRFEEQIDGDALLVDGAGWAATVVRIEVRERPNTATAGRANPKPRPMAVRAAPQAPPRADEGTSAAADLPGDATPGPIFVEPEKIALVEVLPTIGDLRASLGWAPIERAPVVGQRGGMGAADAPGSEQAVTESPIADVLFINAKGTPEGAYTEHLYEILQQRWLAQDLDIESRAIGKQGDVTVVFRVDRSGRVDYLDVTRSSGNEALDAMARNSVPARLPRFPREVKQEAIVQQVLFAYQNPMLVVDPR